MKTAKEWQKLFDDEYAQVDMRAMIADLAATEDRADDEFKACEVAVKRWNSAEARVRELENNQEGWIARCFEAEHDVSELTAAVKETEPKIQALVETLREAVPENMGGYPDLFAPPGGWEEWEEKAKQALAPFGGEA
jgi:hypothetical protein